MEHEKEEFSDSLIQISWKRQGGKCAYCGASLVKDNKDRGGVGAWHAHPKILELGYDLEDNCLLLCINPPKDCHWNIGHNAYNPLSYRYFKDWELTYLYGGRGRHGRPSPKYIARLRGLQELHRL